MFGLVRFVSVLLVVTLTIGAGAAPVAATSGADGDPQGAGPVVVVVDGETEQVLVFDGDGDLVARGENLTATMKRSGLFTTQQIDRVDERVPDELGVASASDCVFVPVFVGNVIPCADIGASAGPGGASASASTAVLTVVGTGPTGTFFGGGAAYANAAADTSGPSGTVEAGACVGENYQVETNFCVPVSANPG